ncbi:MAG: TIGR04255 family protein [Dehalococcoidales bacterium]|nr:TIGR04255 family protein [Dehalococcoidales bacterium]
MAVAEDPLSSPPPAEVPLREAPLVRVIAQVRVPPILSIEQKSYVAPFQEAIRSAYPLLRIEQIHGLIVTPSGVVQGPRQTVWRFFDESEAWRVTIAPDFFALETTRYSSRADFLKRLGELLEAAGQHFSPKLVLRLGLRYIDRISGPDVARICDFVRTEVRGIAGTPMASRAVHSICESVFEMDGERVVARWGNMPANATVDPGAIEPIPEASWILDLDMHSEGNRHYSAEALVLDAEKYAERLYSVFRWAITAEFLERYGGAQR